MGGTWQGVRRGMEGTEADRQGQGTVGGKTGLEEGGGRGGWSWGGERREGKEESRKEGGDGVRKSWRK